MNLVRKNSSVSSDLHPERDDPTKQSSFSRLHFSSCELDDFASESLAQFIPQLRVLTHLDLSDNDLSDEAIEAWSTAVLGHTRLATWNMEFSVSTLNAEDTLMALSKAKPRMAIQY